MRKKIIQGCIGVLLVLALWTVASLTGLFGKMDANTAQMLFPLPTTVAAELVDMLKSGYLLTNLCVSMGRVLAGFGIAVAIGLPVGILVGLSENVRNTFMDMLNAEENAGWPGQQCGYFYHCDRIHFPDYCEYL